MDSPLHYPKFDGVDVIFASAIMGELGMTPEDLRSPQRQALLNRAAAFLASEPDWSLTLSRILAGKPTFDPLKVVVEYAERRRAREEARAEADAADEDLRKLELIGSAKGDATYDETRARRDEARAVLNRRDEEIRLYER